MKYVALSLFAPLLLALHLAAWAAPPTSPSYQVVDKIFIGGEARWDYLTVDSAAPRLYVSHGGKTEVIDTATDKKVGVIENTPGVHGIAIASDLGRGFTSNGQDDSVTVFESVSLKRRASVKVGANPDAIVYDAASQRIVTFNGRSKDATVIDAKSLQVLGTVAVGGKPEFAQVGAGSRIYFNQEDTNEIAVLDARAIKLLGRHSLSPCEAPTGLAIDDAQHLYSVCENRLMKITAADGQPLGEAPIRAGSDGVAWLDGAAYSANGGDGTVSAVTTAPGQTASAVETFVTARGARTIAADPVRHRLYLPTAEFQPAKAGARPVGKPDTFYVLVFGHQ